MMEISRRVVPTDNTVLSKLSLFDKIKMIFSKYLDSSDAELLNKSRVSKEDYGLQEDLNSFLLESAENLDKASYIIVFIPVKFKIVLDLVINEKTGLGRFYAFEKMEYRDSIIEKGTPLKMSKRVATNEKTS